MLYDVQAYMLIWNDLHLCNDHQNNVTFHMIFGMNEMLIWVDKNKACSIQTFVDQPLTLKCLTLSVII